MQLTAPQIICTNWSLLCYSCRIFCDYLQPSKFSEIFHFARRGILCFVCNSLHYDKLFRTLRNPASVSNILRNGTCPATKANPQTPENRVSPGRTDKSSDVSSIAGSSIDNHFGDFLP